MLQLSTGGDLFTYITTHARHHLCEGEAKYITFQLLKGLKYLHDRMISHRGMYILSRSSSSRRTSFIFDRPQSAFCYVFLAISLSSAPLARKYPSSFARSLSTHPDRRFRSCTPEGISGNTACLWYNLLLTPRGRACTGLSRARVYRHACGLLEHRRSGLCHAYVGPPLATHCFRSKNVTLQG